MAKDTIYCVQCGAPNLADSRYCTECGSELIKPERSVKSRRSPSAPSRSAPPVAVPPPARATPPSVTIPLRMPAWVWPVLIVLAVVISYVALKPGSETAEGSGSSGVAAATAAGSGIPAAWEEYRGADFTLQMPRDFVGGFTAEDGQRLSQALSQAGFADQSILFGTEALASMGQDLKFFAANPADQSPFADLLLVMSTPDTQGKSVEDVAGSYTDMFADSAGVDLQQISDFSVAGYDTFAFKMDAGDVPLAEGATVDLYYFILMKDGRAWGMIYMTDLAGNNFGESDILQIAGSFRAN